MEIGRLGSRVPALGIKTLSDLEIDVDKDWKAYDIYYLGNLTPKVDGAYNIGSSAAEFNTVYAKAGPPPGADSIGKEELKEPAVDSAYIFDNAVTPPKMASDSIYKRHLRTGVVDTSYLTNNAVTTPKITDGDVTSPKLESDIVYKRHLRIGVVDTSYLTDNAATSAKVGPSVDLEFVRSNDNTVAGDISAAADGAYNLGSSANKFDTAYANNFPGTASVSTKSGNLSGVKGVKLSPDGDIISAGFNIKENVKAWMRQYSSAGAFEHVSRKYCGATGFASSHVPLLSPSNASVDPEGGTDLFSASFVSDGTQIGGFLGPDGNPAGLTWDGTYLWNSDNDADYIYQLKTDGTQVGGFASPDVIPTGLTWDGTYLWHCANSVTYIYQLKTDGTQVGGFASPGPSPFGITWDGTYLLLGDDTAGYIYQLKTDGTQVGGFAGPGPSPMGVGWDGTYLWHSDYDADYIYQLKADGTQVGGFASPTGLPTGLTWDGIYLWHAEYSANYIYQFGSASSMDIAYQVTTVS